MRKGIIITTLCFLAVILGVSVTTILGDQNPASTTDESIGTQTRTSSAPEFYRGIYLTNPSGKKIETLKKFIAASKKAGINVMVIDAQPAPGGKCSIPKENLDLIIAHGIYPIARVVCFEDGLKHFPVPEEKLKNKIDIAKSACANGFKEIQFDYIRFEDYGILRKVPLQKKFEFIEGFLARARNELKPYNVKIAADIFGRIPLNSNDGIGQRMEGLDKVTDVICPMAYPSHYTWSKKMMSDPYYTVFLTSSKAKVRAKQADIVSYIQAFKIRVGNSGLSYDEYIRQQVKATYDSEIRGFIFWNAAQEYTIPFKVAEEFNPATKKISAVKPAKKTERSL